MGEIEPPIRQSDQVWQCRCLITKQVDRDGEMVTVRDKCYQDTGSPDAPFCDFCLTRHPDVEEDWTVGAVLPHMEITRKEDAHD